MTSIVPTSPYLVDYPYPPTISCKKKLNFPESESDFSDAESATDFIESSDEDLSEDFPLDGTSPSFKRLPRSCKSTSSANVARKLFSANRGILDINQAPSIQQPKFLKLNGKYDSNSLSAHAYMRIQLFAITATIIHGIAKRSFRQDFKDITLKISGAVLQVGQGSHGYHAAHDNASSGLKDNLREVIINLISQEHTVTPKTAGILKCKGFTASEIQAMQTNCLNISEINKLFNIKWPLAKNYSVISGTSVEKTLNSTTELPQAANLLCDKSLETFIRPKTIVLYESLMKGLITIEDACKTYVELIIGYFDQVIPKIHERLNHLAEYKQSIEKLDKTEISPLDFISIIDGMKEIKKYLENKHVLDHEGQITATRSETPLPRAKIPVNESFLRSTKHLINQNFESFLTSFYKKADVIKNEIETQITRFTDYLTYCELEKTGTQLPDFTSLFGEYDSNTKTRALSSDTYRKVQSTLLQSETPKKPKTKKRSAVASPEKYVAIKSSKQPKLKEENEDDKENLSTNICVN